jgi:hypothetical protein
LSDFPVPFGGLAASLYPMNPLILTGMHRSGTSAIARLVQSLGFDLGHNLLVATRNNRHGHFEEMGFIRFHDQLISRYFPDRAPFCEWLPLSDTENTPGEAEQSEAVALWESHRAAGGRAWKDPRTSLFLDLWTTVLPGARVIICLRHPYQVHLSLLRRGEPFLHVDYSAGIRGWTVYNERIRRTLAHLPADRFLTVDVDAAFKEPAQLAKRLAEFLGVPAPDLSSASITPEEFHFEEGVNQALAEFPVFFPEAAALHRALQQSDFTSPLSVATTTPHSIRSEEARLIEFEERCGLREKSRRMLIRSIAADRSRSSELYRLSSQAHGEKDKLIGELSRFTEQLQQEVVRLRATPATDGIADRI